MSKKIFCCPFKPVYMKMMQTNCLSLFATLDVSAHGLSKSQWLVRRIWRHSTPANPHEYMSISSEFAKLAGLKMWEEADPSV